jgi:urate oxidase
MVLFFLISYLGNTQATIQGFVKSSSDDKPLQNVNILIKSLDGTLLTFTFTNKDGFYTTLLPNGHDVFGIEASIISHQKVFKLLNVPSIQNKIHTLDFKLKERVDELEEVYIEGENAQFQLKKIPPYIRLKNLKTAASAQ